MADQYKKDHGLDLFIETSAKTGFNAKNVFIEAAKILYRDYLKYKDRPSRQMSIDSTNFHPYNNNIVLPSPNNLNNQDDNKNKKKKCSC